MPFKDIKALISEYNDQEAQMSGGLYQFQKQALELEETEASFSRRRHGVDNLQIELEEQRRRNSGSFWVLVSVRHSHDGWLFPKPLQIRSAIWQALNTLYRVQGNISDEFTYVEMKKPATVRRIRNDGIWTLDQPGEITLRGQGNTQLLLVEESKPQLHSREFLPGQPTSDQKRMTSRHSTTPPKTSIKEPMSEYNPSDFKKLVNLEETLSSLQRRQELQTSILNSLLQLVQEIHDHQSQDGIGLEDLRQKQAQNYQTLQSLQQAHQAQHKILETLCHRLPEQDTLFQPQRRWENLQQAFQAHQHSFQQSLQSLSADLKATQVQLQELTANINQHRDDPTLTRDLISFDPATASSTFSTPIQKKVEDSASPPSPNFPKTEVKFPQTSAQTFLQDSPEHRSSQPAHRLHPIHFNNSKPVSVEELSKSVCNQLNEYNWQTPDKIRNQFSTTCNILEGVTSTQFKANTQGNYWLFFDTESDGTLGWIFPIDFLWDESQNVLHLQDYFHCDQSEGNVSRIQIDSPARVKLEQVDHQFSWILDRPGQLHWRE